KTKQVTNADFDLRFQTWLNQVGNKVLAIFAPSQAKALKKYNLSNIHIFCMGSRTKEALLEIGIQNIHVSKSSSLSSLMDSCKEYLLRGFLK
ncbi:hypothetical protein MJH12_02650, partial [bacterium]|nr:hypothetical protein [bacterium]